MTDFQREFFDEIDKTSSLSEKIKKIDGFLEKMEFQKKQRHDKIKQLEEKKKAIDEQRNRLEEQKKENDDQRKKIDDQESTEESDVVLLQSMRQNFNDFSSRQPQSSTMSNFLGEVDNISAISEKIKKIDVFLEKIDIQKKQRDVKRKLLEEKEMAIEEQRRQIEELKKENEGRRNDIKNQMKLINDQDFPEKTDAVMLQTMRSNFVLLNSRQPGSRSGPGPLPVVWTAAITRSFDAALVILGREAAAAEIQELMAVEGLTVDQVASHMQRVAEDREEANLGKRTREDHQEEGETSNKLPRLTYTYERRKK